MLVITLSLPPSSLSLFFLPFFHYSFYLFLSLSLFSPLSLSVSLSLCFFFHLFLLLSISFSLSQRPLSLGANLVLHSMTKYLYGNPFNFSNKHFKFSTFLLGHCDVLMGALCTNNKEIHDKLKFLQLGKDVVRLRILSVVIELSRIFCIFLYILVNLSILLCSSSTFVNFCVFLYTSVFSLFVSVY